MLRPILLPMLALAGALTALPARALEYRSLADNAIVYDACSAKAKPLFILMKGTPVEVIVSVEKWVKIREQSGGLGCLESGRLGNTAHVIVTAPSASVHQAGDEKSPPVFSVARQVVLEVVEKPTGGWVRVRHRDGQTGYIPIKSVWGI
ncbi:MAG: SH3 domain-containing protein [Candidatus Dactylopiibacterium sp.]|nr:SH3 domain-containing protein [Candidatus Dactylopiibacterium sp.]